MPLNIRPVNTPITNPQKPGLLARLAANPLASWQHFKRGLLLFALGAVGIYAGAYWWLWLQVPGLLLLTCGIGFAGWGYAGILAHRLLAAFKPTNARAATNKNTTPPG